MIEYRGVGVRYPGVARDTVRDVSFVAERGKITALVGPNGSGKSTLVRALLRRAPRVAGDILVDGKSIDHIDRGVFAQRVAVITQQEETTFARPVAEYIALGLHPHGRDSVWHSAFGSDSVRAHIVAESARQAGVEHYLGRRTDELSGGEWQRVRLARALAQRSPKGETFALVLDEPTTFLDVAHEMATFELLDGLAREGTAVLLVSHQLNLVARFADQLVLLHRGGVAAVGTPDEVMRGDVLEPVYEWPLVVTRDPATNALALVPLRRRG